MKLLFIVMTILWVSSKEYQLETTYEICLYEEAIEHLKKYEGFRSTIYKDTDGSPTIGYGHHIIKGEDNFVYITKKDASLLLRRDLDKRICAMKKNHPGLQYNKCLALGLLAFNIGISKLKYYIKRYNLLKDNNINKILNYYRYKVIDDDGVVIEIVESEKLKERRKFELMIYTYEL